MNLLPLRLTPFEQSMWVDDHPAYPWNILYRLPFAGKLELAPLQQALEIVVARHPILTAQARKHWTQRTRWEPGVANSAVAPPQLDWNDRDYGTRPPVRRLQPEAGRSLELFVRTREHESELWVHVHHMAADGVGAIRMIHELLQVYDAIVAGRRHDLPPLEPWRLKRRGNNGLSFLGLLRLTPKLCVGLQGIRQFLQRRPVPLVPHEAVPRDQPMPADFPLLRSHTLTATETTALRNRARSAGATLNDLLARDLFLALHGRRRRLGLKDDEWLRLAVPVDMRTPADDALPSANVVSMVFLDRRPSNGVDPAALLRSVHEEMQLIKRNHLELIYLLVLRFTDLLPNVMGWLAAKQKFTCSALLSNLMRPFDDSPLPRDEAGDLRVGTATLRSLEFYPPLRPYMCAAYGAATYAGRLTLALNADPRFLSPTDADELLGDFVAQVKSSLTAD